MPENRHDERAMDQMADRKSTLADLVEGDLPARWEREKDRLSQFLKGVGLTEGEHSKSLYVTPKTILRLDQFLEEFRPAVDDKGQWAFLTGKMDADQAPMAVAFPVNKKLRMGSGSTLLKKSQVALFIEVHSRLVSWWLVNAWCSAGASPARSVERDFAF
jgi:hypothetical protein